MATYNSRYSYFVKQLLCGHVKMKTILIYLGCSSDHYILMYSCRYNSWCHQYIVHCSDMDPTRIHPYLQYITIILCHYTYKCGHCVAWWCRPNGQGTRLAIKRSRSTPGAVPLYLSPRAVQFGTGQRAVMPCGLAGSGSHWPCVTVSQAQTTGCGIKNNPLRKLTYLVNGVI